MAVYILYGHRYYGRVDRAPGLFHVATLFFHVNYLPIYPLQSCLIREDARGGYDNAGSSVGLWLKSVVLGYLRGWLGKHSAALAFGGGLLSGLALWPWSKSAAFVVGLLLALALGFAHKYVLTEEPSGRTHPAANRLLWQLGLTGLTLVVGGGQLLAAAAVVGMAAGGIAEMLRVLPLVVCALFTASEVLGYAYRLSLFLTPAGYERALDLAAECGVSRRLVEKRYRRRRREEEAVDY